MTAFQKISEHPAIRKSLEERDIREKLDPSCWAIIKESEALRAIGDRVLILEDDFRSGYECKACKGTGHTDAVCKYCNGTTFYKGKEDGGACGDCQVGTSDGRKSLGFELCGVCNGRGASVIVPDTSKRPSLTGRVVSVGADVTLFSVNDRVMYTNYTGTDFVVAGVKLRVMRQHDVLCQHKKLDKGKERTPDSGGIRKELTDHGVQPLD
jgi:hypothetical protein